ncbi:glucans biosynthesis glucosyltransferase MdoH [Pseudoxanthomonas sangjuensis]|nr:glucans biosynthesis glucosyltransferase MdoH [Pseudoxanthomonas sangjuensis]KAF1713542.1 glucans biosynthesis glucosyltransferase MdoH [Pseudoxanthomonas sangjuensis]
MTAAAVARRAREAPIAEMDWLPAEAPLAMPVQALHEGRLSPRRLPTSPRGIGLRRALVIGGAALLTLAATWQVWWALRDGGLMASEAVLLALFAALFGWVALSFTSTLAGFFLVLLRRDVNSLGIRSDDPLPELSTRTALLMPTYNEDPQRLLAGLQAVCESVAATGQAHRFDFFVLSDTNRAALQSAEEAAFLAFRERLGDGFRVYYRRRDNNVERKAGNVAEWVRRFGGAYPHFLILDADSLMSGRTIVRLAAALERNPGVALVQSLPVIVNGRTPFARMQQFAGRVYGPVMAYGIAWWHGAEGNYWGHNAIIRTAAFAANAGLPELRGRKPFAGNVLSHDFVEAALLRRGGWALHMAPGLSGSYEEGPPSLTDMLVRDRRWCQGNLQHGGVIGAKGLHWLSRLHLGLGIAHYFTAFLWGMSMLAGLAIPLQARLSATSGAVLQTGDTQRLLWVFAFTLSVLLAPKALGFLATCTYLRLRRGCGGALRCLTSVVLETLMAALMAPITMYVQTRGLAEVLAGKDSGWEAQRRDDGSVPFASLARRYGGLTLFGVFVGILAWMVSPRIAAWMSPVIAGMVLSIPVVALTGSGRVGQWLRRLRLLQVPEEIAPPPVVARAAKLRGQSTA